MRALTTNRVSPREQGVLIGVSTALGSLMSVLGPLWAGAVYDQVMPGDTRAGARDVFALLECGQTFISGLSSGVQRRPLTPLAFARLSCEPMLYSAQSNYNAGSAISGSLENY
jgi:hypothetical protein